MQMYTSTKTFLAWNRGLLIVGIVGLALLWSFLVSHRAAESMSTGVLAWWTALCAISLFNVCGWRLSAAAIERQKATAEPAVYVLQRRQLVLAAVFVLGCGFRAILPRADVQRIGLFDSWVSSVMLGRSV